MITFLRRLRSTHLSPVCDSCAQVCTADYRAEARYDRVRTAALTYGALR